MNSVPPKNDFFCRLFFINRVKTKAQKDPESALKDVCSTVWSQSLLIAFEEHAPVRMRRLVVGLFSSRSNLSNIKNDGSKLSQGFGAKSEGLDLSEALISSISNKQQGLQHARSERARRYGFLESSARQDLVRIQALAHRASTEFIAIGSTKRLPK